VAHIAEECALGAIDLGQCLRSLAFLLICASASQPDGDLFGDPMDELAVCVIKGPARVDSHHKETHID
jgi:hypothetical protein